jgi:hypothetical protein
VARCKAASEDDEETRTTACISFSLSYNEEEGLHAPARERASSLFGTQPPRLLQPCPRALGPSQPPRRREQEIRTLFAAPPSPKKIHGASASWSQAPGSPKSTRSSAVARLKSQGSIECEYKEQDITRPPVRATETKSLASGYHNWLTAPSHDGTDSPITQERRKEKDGITALSIPVLWKERGWRKGPRSGHLDFT